MNGQSNFDVRKRVARFLGSDHRRRLAALLRLKPVLAAVAYVSDASDLPLKRDDVLVCDASDAAARAGSTRREALAMLLSKGVEIWSRSGLHAKVVVAGSRALVGSANWSARSASVLVEAGVEVSDALVVADVATFVRGLAQRPSARVTQAFLRQMPEPEGASPLADLQLLDGDNGASRRHWLVCARPVEFRGAAARMAEVLERDRRRTPPAGVAPRELDSIVWSGPRGPGRKMQVDDTVTVIWRERGARAVVYPPCTVLRVRRKEGVTGILYLFTRAQKARALEFDRFAALGRRAGLPRVVEGSNRQLTEAQFEALGALWPRSRRGR